MISAISGELVEVNGDDSKATISTGLGLDFDVKISSRTATIFVNEFLNKRVKLYTYVNISDEKLIAYGFYTLEERELFLKLITINSIGPKLAMKILSSMSVEEFYEHVKREDAKAIASIPGLGTKSAASIILDLRAKIIKEEKKKEKKEPKPSASQQEVIKSLVAMGWAKEDCKVAVLKAVESSKSKHLSDEELFKLAFANLNQES